MLHSVLSLGFSAGEQPTFASAATTSKAAPPSDYILLENRDMDSSWSGKSHRWNQYVVPGYAGGVSPSPKSVALGHEKTDADLELAKHLCDRYDSCDHFNSLHYVGPGSGGSPSDYIPAYPGEIGSFKPQPKADTYLKGSIGEVVPGSCAYPCARYFHLTNVSSQKKTRGWCNRIANGPAAGSSVDTIKAACDANAACDGFTVMKDLSSSFLCAFEVCPTGPADVFIKMANSTAGACATSFACDEVKRQCVADAKGVFPDKASCDAKCQ